MCLCTFYTHTHTLISFFLNMYEKIFNCFILLLTKKKKIYNSVFCKWPVSEIYEYNEESNGGIYMLRG